MCNIKEFAATLAFTALAALSLLFAIVTALLFVLAVIVAVVIGTALLPVLLWLTLVRELRNRLRSSNGHSKSGPV